MPSNLILPNALTAPGTPAFPTGARRSSPTEVLACRVTLARARGLAEYHGVGISAPPPTPSGAVVNSTNLLAALAGANLGFMGNDGFGDCVSAEEGHHKQIISSCTRTSPTLADIVNLPYGTYYGKAAPPVNLTAAPSAGTGLTAGTQIQYAIFPYSSDGYFGPVSAVVSATPSGGNCQVTLSWDSTCNSYLMRYVGGVYQYIETGAGSFVDTGAGWASSPYTFTTGTLAYDPTWQADAENAPGVLSWAEAFGFSSGATLPQVLTQMGIVGMKDAAGARHVDGANPTGAAYPYWNSIDYTNQAEFILALRYFKTIKLCVNHMIIESNVFSGGGANAWTGTVTNFWWSTGVTPAVLAASPFARWNGDHCMCACDCGTAAQLAAAYGISVPSYLDPSTFCVGIIGWAMLGIVDWLTLQTMTCEAYVRITDPDRGDASTFNPVAEADYLAMTTAPPSNTVLNSTAAITANGGCNFGRQLGNGNYQDCAAAAAGWHKAIITSATGATMLFLPEGGDPVNSDTEWGSGGVPANSPGVIAWAEANGVLGFTTLSTVLALLATAGTWPHGGFVDSSGGHHPITSYGAITASSQTQVIAALEQFKTVIFRLSGDQMLSQWEGGSRFFAGLSGSTNYDHDFCACDCGQAWTLAAQYGIALPDGYDPTTFCLGGITWGTFAMIEWTSLLNVVSGAYVVIADPDRADAAAWNPTAQCYYRALVGTNAAYVAAAQLSYAA